jgi:glutathione S-transferase
LPVDVFAMKQRQFVAGDRVTVADFVVAYTLDWANEVQLLNGFPQLLEYLERMYARPHAPPRSLSADPSCRLNPVPGARSRALAGRPLR